LAGSIKCNRIGPIFSYQCFKYGGSSFQCCIPRNPLPWLTFAIPHFWVPEPVRLIHHRIMKVHSFAAKHAFIYRMIFISFNPDASVFFFVNLDATAYTAIATRGFVYLLFRRNRCFNIIF